MLVTGNKIAWAFEYSNNNLDTFIENVSRPSVQLADFINDRIAWYQAVTGATETPIDISRWQHNDTRSETPKTTKIKSNNNMISTFTWITRLLLEYCIAVVLVFLAVFLYKWIR